MWVPARITRFGIADQRCTLPTSGQNDDWKKPLKPEVTWIRKQNVDSDWFRPAEHEYMHIWCIWPKTTVKITVKLRKNWKLHVFFFRKVLGQNLYKWLKWNFPQTIIRKLWLWLSMFWPISIIDDVTAAILVGKTRALSRPQFWFDFLEIWYVGTCEDY